MNGINIFTKIRRLVRSGDDSEFSFWIKINKDDTLIKLMYFIHNEVAIFLKRDKIQNLTLGKFVKITNNSFEIVEEIPF